MYSTAEAQNGWKLRQILYFFKCVGVGELGAPLPGNREAESSLSPYSHASPRCSALGLSPRWGCTATDLIPKLTASLHPGPQVTKTHVYGKRGEP